MALAPRRPAAHVEGRVFHRESHLMSADPRFGAATGFGPRAFDPVVNPELIRGVLSCRLVAFLIDVFVIALPIVAASIVIALLGIVTFGLGWLLFWPLYSFAAVWAILYYGFTLGGQHSATVGMRAMGIEMRTLSGEPANFLIGALHPVLYWISISVFFPILLVGLFNGRRQLFHDMILGVVLINGPARAMRFTRR